MQKKENSYEHILQEFFYPEHDLQQMVLGIVQKSLVDLLAIKESWSKIKEHLEKGELPSEYLYLTGAEIYNRNCFSVNSPYHAVALLEAGGLLKNAPDLEKYLGSTIIDIGCGNGAKPAGLLKYLKSIGLGSHIKKYIGLDGSVSMLRATDDNFHKAGIPNLEYETGKQRFQELKSDDIKGKKTFTFLGGSLGTFTDPKEFDEFLQDVKDNMSAEDTFVATVFTLPEEDDKSTISDQELKELQKRFIKAERERYDIHNLREHEKQIDIDMLRNMGVEEITIDDFDIDFFFDEDSQKLIDRKTFKKDIVMYGDVIFPKGFSMDSPGTLLDRDFFLPMVEKKVKDFSESIYNTNQSREFVLNFFEKYLHVDPSKLAYKAKWNETTHTMEIFVQCLEDLNIYIQDDQIQKNKGDKFMIHQSHRFTHNEIENKFTKNGFEIVDGLQIGGDLQLLKKLVHEEIMKIYILKKK
ncbi:L-histidine N(alpha)-methyltransferase [Candidatus Gracilibacteria bacterium]|nr:L-histidine N(alpha)-methyltransferase [Candidatus Gracilibacteria bacterium]